MPAGGGWHGGTQPGAEGPGWVWRWVHPYSLPGAENWGGATAPPTHLPLHTEALAKGAPSTVLSPRNPAGLHPAPPPLLFHPDSRFPIAVATSGMATSAFCKGMSPCALPIPGGVCVSPPQGGMRGAGVGGRGLVCRVPGWASLLARSRPQNQRRSVLQQLKRRAGRFALEAAGLILPAGAGLGAAGTWQLRLGLSGGSRGAVVGNGFEVMAG